MDARDIGERERRRPSDGYAPGMTVQTQAICCSAGSMEPRRNPYNLTIEAVESVMAPGLTRVAFIEPAAHPDRPGAAGRPLDERFNTGRQCRPAAILAVMDHERARQRRR